MSTVDPSKITPEIAKFIEANTELAVSTEAELQAAAGALENTLRAQNEQAINSLNTDDYNRVAIAQVNNENSFQRGSSNKSDPIIQGPTRAQDTFSLRQSPTALMTGVPRQKFEYLATFRFAGEDLFETIFANSEQIESLDQQILTNQQSIGSGPPGMYSQRVADLKRTRSGAMDALKRSLVFNIKQIDGPKVNFQYDTLNQYNRKRNVYRRIDYDPISVRFYDTMNNAALKLFKYLYELNSKDGRNRSDQYGGNRQHKKGLYQTNPLSSESDFLTQHSFGLESSISNTTYPIKSLDLFIVHGRKYNLIRFVHPKIISMDHDVLTYESSAPIEIGMQFAYETVIYETLNYDMADAKDVSINFDEYFQNSLTMPDTPITATTPAEGSSGTSNSQIDWTRLTTAMPDEQRSATVGSGSNVMNSQAFAHDVTSAGAAYGGSLQNISTTPFSDAIDKIASEVYSTTKSAVSSFSAGGKSGGGSTDFFGGLGDKFKSATAGTGKYNPDSKNYVPPKGGVVKDSSGKIIKDSNGNAIRQGTRFSTNY